MHVSAVYDPANDGFMPDTYCPDSDPLEISVPGQDGAPGVRIPGKMGQDLKLIAVHLDEPMMEHLRDWGRLRAPELTGRHRNFENQNVPEGKKVSFLRTPGAGAKRAPLRAAMGWYPRGACPFRGGKSRAPPHRGHANERL